MAHRQLAGHFDVHAQVREWQQQHTRQRSGGSQALHTHSRVVQYELHANLSNPPTPALPCRSFTSLVNSSKVTQEQKYALLAGAPFVDGRSTAELFYSVSQVKERDGTPVPGLWLYTYHQFYRWVGACLGGGVEACRGRKVGDGSTGCL
jgi:hypothetical protein